MQVFVTFISFLSNRTLFCFRNLFFHPTFQAVSPGKKHVQSPESADSQYPGMPTVYVPGEQGGPEVCRQCISQIPSPGIELRTMSVDFVKIRNNKTAVRNLPTPFVDTAAFDTVVGSVLADNPFGCVPYEQGGETIPGVTRGREQYTARIVYLDAEGRRLGAATVTAQTTAGMNAAAGAVLDNAALTAAVGGTPHRDAARDSYSCQLRCRDPNGENYALTFARRVVRLTSFEDNAIMNTVEEWADTVPDLC